MLAIYADEAVIRHVMAFEAALAHAEARHGVIDEASALAIEQTCATLDVDLAELAEEVALAGTLAIPVVARLKSALDPAVAGSVHKGATSQDIADSVMMLQARQGAALLRADIDRISDALARVANDQAGTAAIGRTLLQDALPIGFGLRVAQWQANIAEAGSRLRQDVESYACLQFGGPAGTRAGLGGKGDMISRDMAEILGLPDSAPWHSRRIGPAAIASSLGIVIGALGKFARDLALLSQNSIGEAFEPMVAGRGGSSAMAHKRNPTGCQVALAAAYRAPGLVSAIIGALSQEEERGLGGWQAEGPALSELFLIAAGSADALATVAEGLEVDRDAITRNLTVANLGDDIGESEKIVRHLIEYARKG